MNSSRLLRRLNAVVALMTSSNSPFSTAAVFVATDAWQRVSKEFYKMKKLLICTLLTVALGCCGTTLFAQMEAGSGQGGGMHRMPMSSEDRLQHLTQMLNLTSDQQQKIRPILDNESQQMQSLRSETSMTRQDKMTKLRSIRENTMSQITPILTSDQQKKLQEIQSEHMGRHRHGGAAQGSESSPPPQP